MFVKTWRPLAGPGGKAWSPATPRVLQGCQVGCLGPQNLLNVSKGLEKRLGNLFIVVMMVSMVWYDDGISGWDNSAQTGCHSVDLGISPPSRGATWVCRKNENSWLGREKLSVYATKSGNASENFRR